MRSLLVALAALLLFVLGWLLLGGGGEAMGEPEALDAAPTALAPSAPESDLDVMTQPVARAEPEESRTSAAAVAAEPEKPDKSHWPKGFSQLVVRVVAAERPVSGVTIEVPTVADARLDGDSDDKGRGVTGKRGEVRFFVRPTRTVLIRAREPKSGRAVEGTYTTPFEGRTRVVELTLGAVEESGLAILILTELGGMPLPGAKIEVLGGDRESTMKAAADGTGVALVPDEPDFKYRISHAGFVTETFYRSLLEDAREGVEEGGPVPLRLRPFAHVTGVLGGAIQAPLTQGTMHRDQLPSAIAQAVRAQQSVELRPERGPERSRVDGVTFDTNLRFHRRSASASVDSDGSWSIQAAIPRDEPYWEQVEVVVSGPSEARRQLATITMLRPGDHVTIEDPWKSDPGLALVFQDASGAPTFIGKRVLLGQQSVEATRRESVASVVVDSEGGVHLPELPLGDWIYLVDVPGAPPSWWPSGTFQHAGARDPVVVTFPSEPLVVVIPPRRQRRLQHYRLGVFESGGRPASLTSLREGGRITFPWVPPNKSWNLWLVPLAGSFAPREEQQLGQDSLRSLEVPILPGDREIVLRPE